MRSTRPSPATFLATRGGVVVRRWLGALVVAALLGVGTSGCGDGHAPSLENPDATGRELVNRYFRLLADRDRQGLEDFISSAFIVQRADGSTDVKDGYLADLPEIDAWKLSDLTAIQDGDALVVRYNQTVEETIGGKRFRTDPAPRLSTFVWSDGAWRLSSHANFNVPR